MNKSPIFVMSFNRPNYLEAVLKSLRSQEGADLSQRKIALFQDGAVNPYSGLRHATDDDVQACVKIFQRIFPEGTLIASPVNLGVALNFDVAEKFGFEEIIADSVIFLEDDLVLTSSYIYEVDRLVEMFKNDDRVGYVAAYGNLHLNIERQKQNEKKLSLLYHNWGFALFRRHWLKVHYYTDQYLELVRKVDYRRRDNAAIRRLYDLWGFEITESSQDVAKTLACCLTKTIKINTTACFAKYIGASGLHMSPDKYENIGYAKTVTYPERIEKFMPLDESDYNRLFSEQLGWARAKPALSHQMGNPRVTSSGEAKSLKGSDIYLPSVNSEEKFVSALYRVFLHREPDAGGLDLHIKSIKNGKSLEAVMRSFLGSQEFIKKHPGAFREFRLASQIDSLKAAQAAGRVKLVLGSAGTIYPGWVSTDADLLDLLKPDTWAAFVPDASIEAMLAEHVWEHLDDSQALEAARTCYRFLAPGKHVRIAVPDAFMPDREYHELCKIGNRDGHKNFFNYKSLSAIFRKAKFTIRLLEYWDKDGVFHGVEWDSADGHIMRSSKYDSRNSSGKLVYTSLIIDAIKMVE